MTDPIKLCHLGIGCIAYESCTDGTCVVREAVEAERGANAQIAFVHEKRALRAGDSNTAGWCLDIAAAITARGEKT